MGRKAIDYLKKSFDSGIVLKKVEKEQDGLVLWECLCSCGNTTTKTSRQLSRVKHIKCDKCLLTKLSTVKIGNRYSRWEVIGLKQGKGSEAKVTCRCECGVEKDVAINSLVRGTSKSCGCLTGNTNNVNGLSKTPEWRCYHGMKSRCLDVNRECFEHYGGRGIKVCDRWLEPSGKGFLNFLEDMGKRPSAKHSLDRIDVNKDYCKENCRWATRSVQAINRRKISANSSGRTGVYWYESRQRWVVKMMRDGKEHWGGQAIHYEDAVKMAEKLEMELFGFSRKDYQGET